MTKNKQTYKELEDQIAELKKQNEILKLSNNSDKTQDVKYRKMLGNIGDVIVIIDREGCVKYKSPNIEKFFGWKPEDVIGKSIFENIHAGDSEFARKFISTLMSEPGIEKTTEVRYKCKDGSYKWIELTCCNLLHDPDINGLLGNYHDITGRKQTETKLLSSEAQLSNAVKIAKLSNWEYDVVNDIFTFNDSFYNIFRATAQQIGGYTMSSAQYAARFVHPDDMPMVAEEIKKSIAATDPHFTHQLEHRIVYADGETGTITVRIFIVKDAQGRTIKTFGVNQDITERKQMEADLLAAKEKAEESNRLKSAFLANMSHEIRTPMNGILGFADLLKEPGLSGEEQQEFIGIIEKSGTRMLNIINDIISISKIESGQMEVNLKASNINEQIEYIYTFFKPEITGKGVRFSFKCSLPLRNAVLKTDSEKVYAILTNLVKNAIKFTSAGSIELGYEIKGEYLEFYVKDTGAGIPKNRQEAIFERFIQADITDERAGQGAGLGLSISKAYIEMLGGKIWVESEVGKGSTFYFTLPYRAETIKEKRAINKISPPVEAAQMTKLKILIVEDEETSEKLISIAVKKIGSEIITVKTGTEAVAACLNNPDIDLVLMDIQMLEMDGYEATRQIRKFDQDVIIIAQTACALSTDKEKAIAAGCDDYISKPIKVNELRQIINKHLNLKKQ